MSDAVPGHGALLAMEQDPAGAQAVFTTIAELNSDIQRPAITRGETNITPHNDDIDFWVHGVMTRGPLTFSTNYIFDDATHDHVSGLYLAMKTNERRGFRITGPSAPISPLDEWICSGNVQSLTETDPVREGARTLDVIVRMVGKMLIDGVAYPS